MCTEKLKICYTLNLYDKPFERSETILLTAKKVIISDHYVPKVKCLTKGSCLCSDTLLFFNFSSCFDGVFFIS